MRVALLGGSFDPPHLAHVQLVKHLLDSKRFDEVWILPSPQNPLKGIPTPFEDRLEMTRLALSKLSTKVRVRGDEENLSGYTIDLVQKLKKENPGAKLTFVGGSDLRAELPSWKDSENLLGLLNFEFLPRPPDPASPFLPISSTQIREQVKNRLPIADLVPKAVEEYILDRRLYL